MKKNIVYYVTRQYMKQNKKRTWTTFLGIVCMVLLMTCVFVGKNTGLSFMSQVAAKKEGKWHVSFYGAEQGSLEAAKKLPYVSETAVSANYGSMEFPGTKNRERPYLTVKAYTENCFDWFNLTLKEGRFPENGQELAVSESVLKDGADLKIGDELSADFFDRSLTGTDKEVKETMFPFFDLKVRYGETTKIPGDFPYYEENESFRENKEYTGKKKVYKVVGILNTPGFENTEAAGYPAVTALGEEEWKELPSFNFSIQCDLENTPDMFGAELHQDVPCESMEFNDYLLAFSENSSDNTINAVLRFLTVFFVLLIMTASAVLIYNVFNISYRERSRYLGMLSSVGATGRQKRSSIYYEAFFLLVPALFAGLFLGMGVIKAGIMAIRPILGSFMSMEDYVNQVPVTLKISVREILAVILVSTVTVLFSAFLPARKIGKTGPLPAIRGNGKDKKEKPHPMRLPFGKKYMGERLLAKNTRKRQKRKTRSIVAAAVTFMVIMTVTAFGASAVKNLANAKIGVSGDLEYAEGKWDYVFSFLGSREENGELYEEIKKELLKNPSVKEPVEWYDGMFAGQVLVSALSREYREAVREIYSLYYRKNLSQKEFEEMGFYDKDSTQPLCILGVDDETLKAIAEKSGADYGLLKESPSVLVVKEGELSTENVVVSEKAPVNFRNFHIENMTDLKKGEMLEGEFYSSVQKKNSPLPMEIAGFVTNEDTKEYMTFHSQFLWGIVSQDTINQMLALLKGDNSLLPAVAFRWDGKDSTFLEKLEELGDGSKGVYLSKLETPQVFAGAIIDMLNVMSVCFVLAASGICLLNMFNSIRGRMEERKGEFAVLRSVGMTKGQLRRMLLIENLGLLAKSLLYGAAITGAVVLFLQKALSRLFGNTPFAHPWGWFALALLLMAGAVLVITELCLKKEQKENLLENIPREGV